MSLSLSRIIRLTFLKKKNYGRLHVCQFFLKWRLLVYSFSPLSVEISLLQAFFNLIWEFKFIVCYNFFVGHLYYIENSHPNYDSTEIITCLNMMLKFVNDSRRCYTYTNKVLFQSTTLRSQNLLYFNQKARILIMC